MIVKDVSRKPIISLFLVGLLLEFLCIMRLSDLITGNLKRLVVKYIKRIHLINHDYADRKIISINLTYSGKDLRFLHTIFLNQLMQKTILLRSVSKCLNCMITVRFYVDLKCYSRLSENQLWFPIKE